MFSMFSSIILLPSFSSYYLGFIPFPNLFLSCLRFLIFVTSLMYVLTNLIRISFFFVDNAFNSLLITWFDLFFKIEGMCFSDTFL